MHQDESFSWVVWWIWLVGMGLKPRPSMSLGDCDLFDCLSLRLHANQSDQEPEAAPKKKRLRPLAQARPVDRAQKWNSISLEI